MVDTTAQCYEVLGLVHAQWRPIPGEFDDYIAQAKPNGYQSLHTAVVGEDDKPLEIQIRTRTMHEQAERGVAAHWRYKERSEQDHELERRIAWLRRWLEDPTQSQIDLASADEYAAQRIYVLSPQGKVIELPANATPVDFAYAIHSDVGHRCRGAKVDGRIVPLSSQLISGQQVEILTTKTGGPSRDWLNTHSGYVTTSKALNRIRHWFKQQDFAQHVQTGRQLLEREIKRLGLGKPDINKLARQFDYRQDDEFLAALGRGDLSTLHILHAEQAKPPESTPDEIDASIQAKVDNKKSRPRNTTQSQVNVQGVGDLMTQIARCCKPVPYDAIIGYITQGRGISVHRQDCRVLQKLDETQRQRLIEVNWNEPPQDANFVVDLQIQATDRSGLLSDISSSLNQAHIDILGVRSQSNKRKAEAHMRITLEIHDMAELSRIIERLSQIPDVMDVCRIV